MRKRGKGAALFPAFLPETKAGRAAAQKSYANNEKKKQMNRTIHCFFLVDIGHLSQYNGHEYGRKCAKREKRTLLRGTILLAARMFSTFHR
jgi:hypothetical protein